ncbi:hypothetical protein [Enterococcus faecalis]|uniref:hypothetical protein n=1 Tax=Enterococcus faecalis TaxID=1351 RepID=UPI0001B2BF3C|nr:hypothetical protein [Enterococcus faecalis]EEU71655.1 predicted protein [Enterococcus faecalis HIP11704]EOJ52768.1 hypothetical protein WM9_00647 [Enterococcus faecalis EnGen0345]EOK00420.1 hypothetical protein WOK_01095 [Enterococcus faecalis EnGen0359]MDB1631193.1 hypothetical protein [Enterococcus faecalis]MDB1634017.1 hypothetical protein [Enterococcus faecalis]
MGKKGKRIKKQNRKRKNAAIANGTYSWHEEKCLECKGKTLIKVEDEYGHAKEIPCPVCNKN